MTRRIDSIPTPSHAKPMKLVVLSAPRTGTLGLYLALKQLGFQPYHMWEVIDRGANEIRILKEGMLAETFHEGKPYGRAEFDKWLADYDVILEVPFYMLHSVVNSYPDAKFLLMERSPEKWAKSYENSTWYFSEFFVVMVKATNLWKRLAKVYWTSRLVENYQDYIDEVKRIVTAEQLKVCKLEDGFGWNELCPYIGVPIPDRPWPALHTPDEFQAHVAPKIKKSILKGLVGVTATLAPLVAVGVWYGRRLKLPLWPGKFWR
ncbi:hypothetical protein F4780DRAFT_778809 [Xylariomycetidae sp. FL0641]|nr:hypothetical protein F4780DRAFT_778809 [Xylariomycetidae sp. FL0641]